MAERPVIVGAAGRPYPGEAVSGDGWTVDQRPGSCRIAVVDGLGHGPPAAAAAAAALRALSERSDLPPDQALLACHQALRGTRGAAISVACIDTTASRLTYTGVGNVEARLWQPDKEQRPTAYRGIVGAALPRLRAFEFELQPDWLLVLHTDGISARFNLGHLLGVVETGNPQVLAESLLQRWGRATDDATVVVARSVPG